MWGACATTPKGNSETGKGKGKDGGKGYGKSGYAGGGKGYGGKGYGGEGAFGKGKGKKGVYGVDDPNTERVRHTKFKTRKTLKTTNDNKTMKYTEEDETT